MRLSGNYTAAFPGKYNSFYHGEKVAFGVLTGLQLTGALSDEIETV